VSGEPAIVEVRVERDRWTALVAFGERQVRVLSDLPPKHGDEAAARAMFAHTARIVADQHDAVVAAATKALLGTYNDTWRQPDGPTLSAVAFAKRLTLDGIRTTDPDNPARLITLYFACGDLFGGHLIECALEWDGSPMGPPHLIG
jgi:hypothetical protein